MTLTTRLFSKLTKTKLFQGRVYYTKTSDRISAQIIHRICTNNHSPVVTDVQKFVENINFWRRYFIHPNKPKWEWLCILKILGLKTPKIQKKVYICIYKLNKDKFDGFKKYKKCLFIRWI